MVRFRGGAPQHRQPDRVSASVCGAVYTSHAHHQRHALGDGLADNTLATTATQTVGELLTTARRLWLYASCRYRPQQRYASPLAPGRGDPAGSAGHERTPYFSEDRGTAVSCRWHDGAHQPKSVCHSALASGLLPGSPSASTPPRCWATEGYRGHPH